MSFRLSPMLVAVSALSVAACGQPEAAKAPEAPAAAVTPETPVAPAAFDLAAVPVSTAPLGASPYFSAPAGYRVEESGAIPATAFPIWLGGGFQTVEGDVHWTRIGAEPGRTLSRLEVARSVDAMVAAAGGVKIASGQVPGSAYGALPEAQRTELLNAFGDVTNSPTTTYVIRRADKTIWVHSVVSIEVAYLSVVDAPAFAAPADSPPA